MPNYIRGLWAQVRYPLGLNTQGYKADEACVLMGIPSAYPDTSSIDGARFLDFHFKHDGTGSTDVYGVDFSLLADGSGSGYAIHSIGKVSAGTKAEIAGLYCQAQLSGGQVTGQAYAAFFEMIVDAAVANMPSGGVIQLASIINGAKNAVNGFIALRDYGTYKMDNLFNFIDLSATPGANTTIFSTSGLKIRIGSTTFYIPVNDASGNLTVPGTLTVTDTTEATSTAGAIHTDGGVSATKKVAVGTDLLMVGGDFDLSTAGTGTYDMILKDGVADALSIRRASTDMMVFDTSTPKITITPATDITGILTLSAGASITGGVNQLEMTGSPTGHMIYLHPTALQANKRAIRIGDYGTEVPVVSGQGLIRSYAKVTSGNEITALEFHWGYVNTNAPVIGVQRQYEVQTDATGPNGITNVDLITGVGASKYVAAGGDGLIGLRSKVYSDNGGNINGNVFAIWVDHQINVAGPNAIEASIRGTTGGSKPDSFIYLETTSGGWAQLVQLAASMADKEPFVATGCTITGESQNVPYLKVLVDSTQYGIPLIAI